MDPWVLDWGCEELTKSEHQNTKQQTPTKANTKPIKMGIRDRMQARQERRQERRNSGSDSEEEDGPKTYAMKEKLLLNIGDDFYINKMSRRRGKGKPAFIANNKVMRLRETFYLQTRDRDTLYQIQERTICQRRRQLDVDSRPELA